MKKTLKKYYLIYQGRMLTALILTSILSIGGGLTIIKSTTANSINFPLENTKEVLAINQQNKLPASVANAVRRDVFIRERISPLELKIIDYTPETWSNGCLDLPQTDELCTQALVPGWRVVVSNGKTNWTYHTNSNGRFLRLASTTTTTNTSTNLPQSVKNAVLRAASKRLKLPSSRLTIIEAQPRTWSDGCLNLGGANEICLQALVEGWRVTVGGGNQILVYHTNETGSVIILNEEASTITVR
ncbi:hypothetical protein [Nodularia sphaerocarpa]|uniref:hypothetical protein n=1 Tax=Nodularia sphaerocarpa TaxID=137816 RepID=UPI001EFBC7B2|nr:hypothetical protein [Nodularia sphaerocarpa]MDB9375495.1 hypothetical protein [Nodularia sphaerocarpa CS-585]MDB9377229.1 hypothetical protein [Nodularia sphaerocarpa CS-585A2]ULP73958.1 hypothetical protein BDGGKGIB_03618 [Nodularia sphaerocarpa UHCC 0038]